MNKAFRILSLLVMVLCLASCKDEAKYYTKKVNLGIDIKRYSRSFVSVEFTTKREGYYLCGIVKKGSKDYDMLESKSDQFMKLVVDSTYIAYLNWRHEYLKEGQDYVADFPSHSLHYCNMQKFFQGLDEDTEYVIYAFVVDPNTKSSAGGLTKKEFRTRNKGLVDIHFDARVDGEWIYIYPKDPSGAIIDYSPYCWDFIDSLEYVKRYGKDPERMLYEYVLGMKPGDRDTKKIDFNRYYTTLGVDVYSDDFIYSSCPTHYIVIADIDGGVHNLTQYKFRYKGDDTKYELLYGRDNIEGIDP